MKNNLLLPFILTLLSCPTVFAQFPSSLDVFCYEYDYTDNDGVLSRGTDESKHFIWVNFQKDCMGKFSITTTLQKIRTEILNNPEKYENYAINDLSKAYNRWPGNATSMVTQQFMGGALPSLYKFYQEYSIKYYTYAKLEKKWKEDLSFYADGTKLIRISDNWNLRSSIYSFSKDRKVLFVWDTTNPEKKKYYKLVDPARLKTNLDFLK